MALCTGGQTKVKHDQTSQSIDHLLKLEAKQRKKNKLVALQVCLYSNDNYNTCCFLQQVHSLMGLRFSGASGKNCARQCHRLILSTLKEVAIQIQEHGLALEPMSPTQEMCFQNILQGNILLVDSDIFLHKEVPEILSVWKDCGMKKRFEMLKEIRNFTTNLCFLLENIERMLVKDYVPNQRDLLYMECIPCNLRYEIDIGTNSICIQCMGDGAWLNKKFIWTYFDDSECVIFATSLTEYNKCPRNPPGGDGDPIYSNRLEESVALFGRLVSYPGQPNDFVIIFLDEDLFLDKIQHTPLQQHLPDCPETESDPKVAKDFIEKMFVKEFDKRKSEHQILTTHFVSTNNPAHTKSVLSAVDDIRFSVKHVKFSKLSQKLS